ncbi:MAG: phosphodiester glycosidase family protein [Phormidesmis sp. RL_2_1]|nr:phosphodiester glycosidase family protein [Phormidesmis sp. RL_2_1]
MSFRHMLPFRHRLSGQPTLRKVGLFGIMTGLGWAALNSVGIQPVLHLLSAPSGHQAISSQPTAFQPVALEQPLEPLQPFQLQPYQPVAQANDTTAVSGNRIQINGNTLTGFWQQKNGRIGISSASMTNLMGIELLSTTEPAQQPVRWFSASQDGVITLPAWWDATDRYLDISDLALKSSWQVQPAGTVLRLNLPQSQVNAVRQGRQTWGDRIVVDLSAPTLWQMNAADGYTITIAGAITPQLVSAFKAIPGNLITQLDVAPLSGSTVIKIKTKDGATPQVWSTGNPNRVVIDIRQDAMVERDVAWAPGLRWRQQYVAIGAHRFPVYMLIARPSAALAVRPIQANPTSAIGIEPLLSQAQQQRVTAAVNAGFFNRNNQLPLGAVRNNGRWISGPILGRGAMAWNDQGDLIMDRFALAESVTTQSGQTLPVLTVNSGYVQAGIGRYTSGWGASYKPIVDGEIVVTVRNDAVIGQQNMGNAGSGSVPIPADGYLLTLRSNRGAASQFATGSRVVLSSQSQPAVFEQYPNVIGGGPLLIRDRNIVLNPQLEGFSTNFIQGSAPRTAVGKTADGTWIIATMHDRVGGRGPTLTEAAQIMQQLGSVDALNLDGGSSSSLYLGGQLLNRLPHTAARVNNGIGLFVLGQP